MGNPIEQSEQPAAQSDLTETTANPPSTSTPAQPSTTTASTTTSNPTTIPPPTNPTTLPPEALDLASKLFDHARSGSTDLLLPYLTAGIPANLTNHAGDTLLMLASYHNHGPLVTLLLQHGADPNALNDKGQSPLAGAVFKGFEEVVRVLVERGADGGVGRPSAVETAGLFKRVECARLLGVELGEGGGVGGVEGARVAAELGRAYVRDVG